MPGSRLFWLQQLFQVAGFPHKSTVSTTQITYLDINWKRNWVSSKVQLIMTPRISISFQRAKGFPKYFCHVCHVIQIQNFLPVMIERFLCSKTSFPHCSLPFSNMDFVSTHTHTPSLFTFKILLKSPVDFAEHFWDDFYQLFPTTYKKGLCYFHVRNLQLWEVKWFPRTSW